MGCLVLNAEKTQVAKQRVPSVTSLSVSFCIRSRPLKTTKMMGGVKVIAVTSALFLSILLSSWRSLRIALCFVW